MSPSHTNEFDFSVTGVDTNSLLIHRSFLFTATSTSRQTDRKTSGTPHLAARSCCATLIELGSVLPLGLNSLRTRKKESSTRACIRRPAGEEEQ
jgi:hypothetical protein